MTRELRGIRGDLDRLNTSVRASNTSVLGMAQSFGIAQVAINLGQRALEGAAHAVVGLNATLEQNQLAFKVMSGSAETAVKHLDDLKALARESAIFNIGDVTEYSKRLQAMGFTTDEAADALRGLGDIAAGVGKDKLPQIVLALGQVKTAGRLTGMELRQFTEAGVPLVAELAKAYNKTTAEIQAMVSEGKIGFESVRFVLQKLTEEGGRFNGMNEEMRKTFNGAMNEMLESLQQTIAKGFEPLFQAMRDGVVEARDFFDSADFEDWATNTGEWIAGVINDLRALMRELPLVTLELQRMAVASAGFVAQASANIRSLPGMGQWQGSGEATRADVEARKAMPDIVVRQRAEALAELDAQIAGMRANLYNPQPFQFNRSGGVGNKAYGPKQGSRSTGDIRPDLLAGTGAGGTGAGRGAAASIREEAGATRELIDEMINAKKAYDDWRESLRAALMTGQMTAGDVAEEFGKANMTADEAFREIEKMIKENTKLSEEYAEAWQKAQDIVAKRNQEAAEFAAEQAKLDEELRKKRLEDEAREAARKIEIENDFQEKRRRLIEQSEQYLEDIQKQRADIEEMNRKKELQLLNAINAAKDRSEDRLAENRLVFRNLRRANKRQNLADAATLDERMSESWMNSILAAMQNLVVQMDGTEVARITGNHTTQSGMLAARMGVL